MSPSRVHATLRGVGYAIGLGLLSLSGAQAAVLGSSASVEFAGGATSFTYLMSTFTFSDNGSGGTAPDSITTLGTGAVTALGPPFQAQFGPYLFADPAGGALSFDSGTSYSGFSTATAIAGSNKKSFIGLEVTDAAGTYYGYAVIDGTELLSYGFETTPGTAAPAGAKITGPIPQPIPEPASLALLATGLLGLTMVRRRGRA